MSEIGLNINVDSYNNEGIKTIKGNNNAEIYKLYILKNKRRLNLVGKTVKLGYVMAGTTKGDIIEDLNITNAEQGEITLPITNRISKKDGVYSCQLAIYREDEFLEYTATFGLTVEANIFTKIAGEIENSKDLTYIERILEEATNISEELKSNIPVARQLNSDLENQNRILNENMDRANGVNNTLITTTEQSKVAATDAIEKNTELQASLEKTKEFIDGLDGSQNIPQIRLDVTELQNGLKSNQALAYQGSFISANDTLEGRTEGMQITGRTLHNIIITPILNKKFIANSTSIKHNYKTLKKKNTKYTLIAYVSKNTLNNKFSFIGWKTSYPDNCQVIEAGITGIVKKTFTTSDSDLDFYLEVWAENTEGEIIIDYMMILEGDWTNKEIPSYFEGIKSFGEAEQEGDKYKISILSGGLNRCTNESINGFININVNNAIQADTTAISYIAKVYKGGTYYLSKIGGDRSVLGYFKSYPQIGDVALNIASGSITVPSHGYIVAYVSSNKNTNNPTNIMISENSNADFQPYQEDKKDILIKEPLRSIGDFSDVMYEDNGQVKITRNIVTYTFTGDEKFSLIASDSQGNYISFLYTSLNNRKYQTKLISNNFVKLSSSQENKEGIYCYSSNFNISIRVLKSKLNTQDVEGFKAWLKANPTTIVYQLDQSTTELYENCIDIDLDTYQEKTYFNILNSLPGTLDFKVPSNIGSVVQNMAKEVNNIWDVINNLLVPGLIDVNKTVAMATIKNNLQ